MARITGSRFSDDIDGTDFNDTIEGLGGNDRLRGFGGDDLLIGGSGDDDLDGGSGADRMEGGAGDDLYVVNSIGDQVVELAGQGIDVVQTSLDTYTLGANVEDLVALSTRDFVGTGNGLDNYIYGYLGDDVLDGRGGNDRLYGDLGDDAYFVDDAGDQVIEYAGEGYDTVFTSLSAYVLAANVEELIFDGSGAFNGTGNSRDNLIEGAAGNDRLDGRDGNDALIGGAGADTMIGGFGDDVFYVDNGSDVVVEASGEGHDRVAASVSYALAAGVSVQELEAITLSATTPINLSGNAFNQRIVGNNGANVLSSGGGNDMLIGLGGNDVIIGSSFASAMYGGTGNDTYYVADSADAVVETAGEGADRIAASTSYTLAAGSEVETIEAVNLTATTALNFIGNGFAQTVIGNYGSNILDGRGGNDVLVGAGGADFFRFSSALGSNNMDRIEDFVAADDTIQLDDAVFTALSAGVLPAGAFRIGTAATELDDRIIYNPATGVLLYDADGDLAGAAVEFATLTGAPPITANDFAVI